MIEAKHTAGPWHVGTDGNVYSGETGGRLIAVVDHNANGDHADSSKPANGRLIAASPDLLAFVGQIAEYLSAVREVEAVVFGDGRRNELLEELLAVARIVVTAAT